MYDDTLTKVTISTMYAAPIFGLLMGAWAYSNQAVFLNYAPDLDANAVYPLNNHGFGQFFTQLTPGTPVFIGLICAITVFFCQRWVKTLSGKLFGRKDARWIANMKLVEMLPPFTDAMKPW